MKCYCSKEIPFTLVSKIIYNFISHHFINHLCQTYQHFQSETEFFPNRLLCSSVLLTFVV